MHRFKGCASRASFSPSQQVIAERGSRGGQAFSLSHLTAGFASGPHELSQKPVTPVFSTCLSFFQLIWAEGYTADLWKKGSFWSLPLAEVLPHKVVCWLERGREKVQSWMEGGMCWFLGLGGSDSWETMSAMAENQPGSCTQLWVDRMSDGLFLFLCKVIKISKGGWVRASPLLCGQLSFCSLSWAGWWKDILIHPYLYLRPSHLWFQGSDSSRLLWIPFPKRWRYILHKGLESLNLDCLP